MIEYKNDYLTFIKRRGVGEFDQVASSPASYISYLNSVSSILSMNISPHTVSDELSVETIVSKLYGQRADKTVSNYRSALRQYVAMVQEMNLR